MSDLKMGPVETRFAEIIWDREPVGSTELGPTGGGGPWLEKVHHLHRSETAV